MGILDDAIREHLELKRRHGADSTEVSAQEREILSADGSGNPSLTSEPAAAPADELVGEIDLQEAPPVPEPLAGSPLAQPEDPVAAVDDLFPGTGELEAAASQVAPPAPPAAPRAAAPAPSLPAPAASDADSETAARSGARRLSDDELAAWRRRLSERADRLAAQRPGGAAAQDAAPATPTPPPAPATPAAQSAPPAYWSGNQSGADVGAPPPVPPAPAPAAPAPATHAAAHPVPEPPADGVPVDFFDAGDAGDAFSPERVPEPEPVVPDHDVLDETPDFLEETPEHDRMWFEQRPPRDFDFG